MTLVSNNVSESRLKMPCDIPTSVVFRDRSQSRDRSLYINIVQLPEPSCAQLFDFDFEKCGGMMEGSAICYYSISSLVIDLSQLEVASLMYMELLAFRPQAGIVNCYEQC